jgi:Flp pilus assembly protein TadB
MIGRSRFVTAGLGLMALALVVAVGPRWAVALCSAAAALRWWRNRSQRRRHQRLIERHLVGVADLLAAALRSGLTCRLAVSVVGTRHPRAELVGLSEVHSLIERGVAPIEALERWSERGGSIRSLASLMVDAERTGAPLADDLCDFASRRRRELRRDAEERARRLPVTLLVPLVVCVLPAFVMVAVVPMLVTGATSLVFPS